MNFQKIRSILLVTTLLFASIQANAQSYFRKKYFVPACINFSPNIGSDLRSKLINTDTACESPLYKGIFNSNKDDFDSKTPYVFGANYFPKVKNKASGKIKYIKANVKPHGKLLIVNPWLGNTRVDSDFAFVLTNRQEIKLSYTQYSIMPITIPVKIQFGRDNTTSFSSGVELGGLFGWSWGRTKFTYRKNLDNFARSHEFTIGGLFSFQSVEIELDTENTRNTVATSLGLGAIYSYDKINLGITGGIEYAHGYGADKWNYQGRPWIGILIGYSIFE